MAEHYDLLVLDGAPHATRATEQIAGASDLVILPTGLALDDLQPGVQLAHELAKHVEQRRLVFALCRVGDSAREIAEARDYLQAAGYAVLSGELPEKTAYHQASDQGRAVTETRYATLNKRAEALAQSIVDRITQMGSEKGT